ncbi:zinc finger CCCH domain-containing protein 33-like [Miscanthus floridulus]|uniref:zinc finger CCCH domain-containing protein 33-like n=1 Tax=Miscanthus floridulus TaxID=154761 RepID=UPI003459B195
MCSGPRKPSTPPLPAATAKDSSVMAAAAALLLELAAADDVVAFRRAAEDDKAPALDAAGHWYGPSAAAAGRLRLEARTPAMVAALYGSTAVLAYVLSAAPAEAARASPTDGATPLHLAAAGGAPGAVAAAHLLLAAGASADALAFSGLRAGDLLPRANAAADRDRALRVLLKSPAASPSSSPKKSASPPPAAAAAAALPEPRKEYPPDLTLPDLKSGLFSTDEFRMYSFKVKPCSRAYSHDWTECPFVHPGENARRRDPRRYSYSCVPCPEFRKGGACRKGDNCEYAHGVFECWLHPAQYRTRLCKDEVGCARRICFFAHKPEELRAVNPSAVSVGMQPTVSSPRSSPPNGLDMGGGMLNPAWPSSPASRLKTALAGRELDFDLELLAFDQYQQKLFDKGSSPRASWGSAGGISSPLPAAAPARTVPDYTDLLGSVDPAMLSQLHALSLKQAGDMPAYSSMADTQLHMPTSPMVGPNTAFGLDHSAMAKAIMSSRASAFAKRSQSFIDRGGRAPATRSLMSQQSTTGAPYMLSDWGSPDGKLDWGVQGDELHKFRKSASFAFRGQSPAPVPTPAEPDVSWVNSLVKDGHAGDIFAQWPEQEQMVA